MKKKIFAVILAVLLPACFVWGVQQNILTTDTVKDALYTKANANFTELYNLLTGAGHNHSSAATGGSTIAPTIITVEAWTNFTPSNADFTPTTQCSYRKSPSGVVFLKGRATTGTAAGSTFHSALISGYRPEQTYYFHYLVGTYSYEGSITTSGIITFGVTAAGHVMNLDGINFKAAP